jgi:hypothetical protein
MARSAVVPEAVPVGALSAQSRRSMSIEFRVVQKSKFLHLVRGVDFPCEFRCRIQAHIEIAVSVIEGPARARKKPGHGFGSDIGPEVAEVAISSTRHQALRALDGDRFIRPRRAPPRKEQSTHPLVDHAASGTRATCALA